LSRSPAELTELAPALGARSARRDAAVPALELHQVHAGYGRVEVLRGVDLAVPRGAVVALLGLNGAGKTTLLNVAAGIVRPTSGCVHVAGLHVNGISPEVLAQAGVCSVPEGRGVFPNLTVNENLRMFTHAGNQPYGGVQERAFTVFPQLAPRHGQLAGRLSGGERQMLSMCRAFATDPAVLLIDEISMGLAPLIVRQLYDAIGRLVAEGMSILIVEQFAAVALEVADYAAVMRLGRIEAAGKPEEIAYALADVYMGGRR
jgi:branched-chain amino acid transport system ATP-binding protein